MSPSATILVSVRVFGPVALKRYCVDLSKNVLEIVVLGLTWENDRDLFYTSRQDGKTALDWLSDAYLFVHLRISLPVLPGQLASVVYVIMEMRGTNRRELFVQIIRWDNLSWLAHFLGCDWSIPKCHKINISKRLWMDEEDLTSSCRTVGLWSNMHDNSPSKSRQYVKEAYWKSVQSPSPEETHTPSHITARSSAPFIQPQRCTLALWIVNRGSNNSQYVTFSLQ